MPWHNWFFKWMAAVLVVVMLVMGLLLRTLQLPPHYAGQAWLIYAPWSVTVTPVPSVHVQQLATYDIRLLDAGIDDWLWRIDMPTLAARQSLQPLIDAGDIYLFQPVDVQGWVVGCWTT